mmetsp:Transcript_10692/g.17248  ORF Transcript_10692/g.17248 Transcript_10692/m.17248 type:complete len:582 (+) Transcript_10692:74-1819(+)
MKLSSALTTFFVGVVGAQRPDRFSRHPKLWMFSPNGVQVYTPDGSQEVSSIAPDQACHDIGTPDEPNLRCYWADAISDGHKYVWATVWRGHDVVDVFHMDTGKLIGSFGTCGAPRDLDYHPLREEIWVHCSDFSDMESSHMDVFSSASPSAAAETRVMLHNNTEARSYGKLVVHDSLGDVAFSTVYGQSYIYRINLAEKVVEKSISIDNGNPKLSGLYEMAYNPKNRHLYVRSQVCCTCGFEGADTLECGRYGTANVTVDGVEYQGQCGRHCAGGPADTIGVFEFDTVGEKLIGNHAFVGSSGVDTPFTSPDGEFVIFFGLNGGKQIDILKPGANGEMSMAYKTLDMDFNSTIAEDISAFDDFAWVQTADKNLFVVASATDFKLALVDMSQSDPAVEYITLSDKTFGPDDRIRDRQIEWVQGSNYVWVSGRTEAQVYVVDIVKKEVVKTFTDVEANKLVSVKSRQYENIADMVNQVFDENGVWEARVPAQQEAPAQAAPARPMSDPLPSSEDVANSAVSSANSALSDSESSGSSNTLSIAALAISCVAIVAVVTNFYMSQQKQASDDTIAGKKSQVPPSVA